MRSSITLASYKESYVTYVTTVTCRRANDRALTTGHRWSLGEADGGAPGAEQPNEHDRGKTPHNPAPGYLWSTATPAARQRRPRRDRRRARVAACELPCLGCAIDAWCTYCDRRLRRVVGARPFRRSRCYGRTAGLRVECARTGGAGAGAGLGATLSRRNRGRRGRGRLREGHLRQSRSDRRRRLLCCRALSLLASAGDHARRTTPRLWAAQLRRAIEADRFGIAAHVLSVSGGCTPDQCGAFALLHDASRVRANLAERPFDALIKHYAAGWPPVSNRPLVSNPPPATTTGAPGAAAKSGTNLYFPSSSSIPPINIMTASRRDRHPTAQPAQARL